MKTSEDYRKINYKTFCLRCDDKIKEQLQLQAKIERRKMNEIVIIALEEYFAKK